jgi:site-specific DNA-methyltransferase (adenine-specific)
MRGEKAELVTTDPPYSVSYADKNRFLNMIAPGNRIQEPIKNDHLKLDDAARIWKAAMLNALDVCTNDASYYWFACQGGDQMMMMMMISDAGWRVRHELIWVKNNHVLGRTDYNYKHEPILFGWKKSGTHRWYGGFQTSVFEFDKPQKSDLHPTTKPTELVQKLILNSSAPNDFLLDLFLGSGTTLVACEQAGRVGRGIEIEPKYVAVALERLSALGLECKRVEENGNTKLTKRTKAAK